MNPNLNTWNVRLLQLLFPPSIVDNITQIQISSFQSPDKWIWFHSTDGNFSVKSAYRESKKTNQFQASRFQGSTSTSISPKLWRLIWSLKNLNTSGGDAAQNSNATAENLCRRNCSSSPICSFCQQDIESIEHILFRCSEAKKFWIHLYDLIFYKEKNVVSISRWTQMLADSFDSAAKASSFLQKIVTVCWGIWNWRNRAIFSQSKADITAAFHTIRLQLGLIVSDKGPLPATISIKDSVLISAREHTTAFVKVFCDGSYSSQLNQGASAFIMLDKKKIVSGTSVISSVSSPLVTEALAILQLCKVLDSTGFTNFHFFSDCLTLINCIKGAIAIPWSIHSIIFDILHLCRNFSCNWYYVPRCFNCIAHFLASSSLKDQLPCIWVSSPSERLIRLIE